MNISGLNASQLVPALNISGLNASHIQDRMEEIGIRKAFGAPRSTLFIQIFIENLLLMFPGSVAGLLFSYGLVALYKHILLVSNYQMMVTGLGETITLSVGMLMNWQVFLSAIVVYRGLPGVESALFISSGVECHSLGYCQCLEYVEPIKHGSYDCTFIEDYPCTIPQ